MTDFGGRIVHFMYEGDFQDILAELGETPLPPYITQKLEDPNRYQTVYSQDPGSVAAPTAGLHFTADLLQRIKQMGVGISYVTLHVGLGTFRPVQVDNINEHHMHAEYYRVPEETIVAINRCRSQGGRVIAVGTTVVRTLETIAQKGMVSGSGWTDIFIYPGYQF